MDPSNPKTSKCLIYYISPIPEFVKIHQASSTAVSFGGENEKSWLKRLNFIQDCDPDELLPLLLPALLRMETLFLDAKSALFPDQNGAAARRDMSFDIQAPFEALRVFHYSGTLLGEPTVRFMASLLKLPAIQRISAVIGDVCTGVADDKSLEELESSSSPLTSLIITAKNLSAANLCHILRAPKALKTFRYSECSTYSIDFRVMRYALGPHKDCLEKVRFDYHKCWETHYMNESRDPGGPMTSFLSFNAIKVFKIAAAFLETTHNDTDRQSLTNIFPPSLETLHLTDIHARCRSVLEALEHLLATKSSQQIPLLTQLILEDFDFEDYEVED